MISDWTEKIDAILEPLLQMNNSLREGLVGCSKEDVNRVESEFGCPLPAAFVALLGRMGRSRGQLMPGADFSFPELLEYRQVADALLSEQEDLSLGERDFVFWMEQGYQFFFFQAGHSDDPAVFFYNDDEPSLKKVSDRFTEWLQGCVQEEIELRTGRG